MKEIRTADISAEERDGSAPMTLTGVPILYDTPTTIHSPEGDFTEIIARGALADAVLDDSTLFYNHDTNRVPLARAPKTMQLRVTQRGLEITAELADTPQAREVWTAVRRGDLRGMSFAFTVPEGGDVYDPQTNTRRILRIAKVYEVSVVPYPAYPTTSVEARGLIRDAAERRRLIIACNQLATTSLKGF